MQRLIYSGAVPLCEKFIKIIVCDIFLNGQTTHRNVKILSYKIITILSSFFDIIHILNMDDEPNIGQDMLDNMMMDSTNDNDNELIFCAYRLINTNLFNRSDKL